MNTSNIKHVCLTSLVVLTLFSCSNDMEDTPTVGEQGLWLKPQIAGTDLETRATGDEVPGVESLNENKLVSLDVFIGKDGDFSTFHKRFTGTLTTTEGTIKIASQNWKTEFPSTNYDVYVVANATSSNIPDITSLTTLGLRTQTDEDIYLPHSASNATEKTFLMDGRYTGWTPSDDEADMITVELNRVAAKIEASLEFDQAITDKYTIGSPTWKLKNCEKTGKLLKSFDYPTVGDDDSGDAPLAALDASTIVTYSYPVKWTDNDDAPYLLINIPLTEKSSGTVKTQNWYRIPVRSISDSETQLDRNHIYYIKAIIASEGSSTEQTEYQDLLLNYSVYDWTTDKVDVNASKTDYLLVSPTLVYMRNIDTDNSVKYYASGDIEIVNKEVYYYDENGEKQTYTDANLVTLTATPTASGSTNGTIVVSSPIPDEEHAGSGTKSNLSAGKFTIRFIRYRVRLKSNTEKYQDILVKQYPLEYIQNIAGWYSTRSTDGWIDWIKDQQLHSSKKTWNSYTDLGSLKYDSYNKYYYYAPDGQFVAKVSESDNGPIYAYYEKSTGYRYKATKWESTKLIGLDDDGYRYNVTLELTNNHMYVIQITRTGSKYTISHPTINPITHLSTEDVASPAFMLASQLGGVTSFTSASDAAKHCATYREVGRDSTIYDNWRLPTPSEIGVIVDYQKTGSGAPISAVLTGKYYWTLDGSYTATGYTDGNNKAVRCVRDLSPEEVKLLDENKK